MNRTALLALALFVSIPVLAQDAVPTDQGAAATQPVVIPPGTPPWAVSHGKITPIHVGNATPATPPPSGLYVAMGDSITHGGAASKSCNAFPLQPVDIEAFCPEGNSYAILTAKALRAAGVAGRFMNLGIGGAKVERVISDELPLLPADATIVSLYIGTNDSRGARFPGASVSTIVSAYQKQYDNLLAAIHKQAPHARIVLLNFPNESNLPNVHDLPADSLVRLDAAAQILDKFIDAHYPQFPVVDLICNPASYDAAMLSPKDGLHPTDDGHAAIAKALLDVLNAEKPAPPPAKCKWFDSSTADTLLNR
jgi:lysophospholipase L1-like esterase